jgi:hypothetical protein
VLTVSQKKGGVPYTWWVDKEQHRILREDNPGSSTVFTSIKLGEPLPDSLFNLNLLQMQKRWTSRGDAKGGDSARSHLAQ